jgi:hypothetical protein
VSHSDVTRHTKLVGLGLGRQPPADTANEPDVGPRAGASTAKGKKGKKGAKAPANGEAATTPAPNPPSEPAPAVELPQVGIPRIGGAEVTLRVVDTAGSS